MPAARPARERQGVPMDEDRFNMAVRKFLKEVGVTSQREIERVVRDGSVRGSTLRLRMTLTSDDAPLEHVVETTIQLAPGLSSG
jgi:16S rRNA U516 pseudouridylate synthase RsuA-like enzyme